VQRDRVQSAWQPGGQQRFYLRAEEDRPVGHGVVEGLDPEPVPRQHQPPFAPIPDCHGEHAAQVLDEVSTVLLVEVDQDLGVAVAGEVMSLGGQLRA